MAIYLNIFLIVGALLGSGICENHNKTVANEELPDPCIGNDGLELAPGKPAVTKESIETTQIGLSWTQPEAHSCPLSKYIVTWMPPDGDGSGENDVGLKTSHKITGLTCNKAYTVNVTARAKDGKETVSLSSTIITVDEAPGKTTDVEGSPPVDDNPTKLDVTWTRPTYKCTGSRRGEYTVIWNSEGDTEGSKKVKGTSRDTTTDKLKPCTTYTISVTGSSSTAKPGIPGTGTGTTSVAAPEKITYVTQEDTTTNSLKVNWNPPLTSENPCPITKYTVQWTNSSDGAKQEYNVTKPPYTIPDLASCCNYTITVIAYTAKGPGPSSEPKIMRTGANVTDIAKVNITPESRSALLTWERPATDCPLEFIVTYSGTTLWTNNQTTVKGGSQIVADPSFTAKLKDLEPYSNYNVCVTIKHGSTTCNTSITEEDVPSAPREVTCASNNDTSKILTWQYPAEENGILTQYAVSWALGSGGANSSIVEANVNSITISDLSKGKYNFTISVNNRKGSSDMSEHIFCDIKGTTACGIGCIAGIVGSVIGVIVVGILVLAFIKRDKKMNRIKSDKYETHEENDLLLKSEFDKLKEINYNRSSDIDDDTLVKLKEVDYVNASYILDKKFIVSPDPMPDQDQNIWQLIYECDIRVIIRINTEGDQQPMAQYIPDQIGVSWVMGADEVDINLITSRQWDGHTENTLKLNKNDESREIKHLHLTSWAETSIHNQEDQAKVLRLISTGRSFSKRIGNKPILIHCGDGSVRTGAVAGIWHLMDQYDQGSVVNTAGCVEFMRKERMSMVQNEEEYSFMDKCIMEYTHNSTIYRRNEN